MQTNPTNSVVLSDLPLFFADITPEKNRSFVKIPPSFRVKHFVTEGIPQDAWMTLAGIPGKRWPCSLIPFGDDYLVLGGWKQFLGKITAGKSHIRLIFQFQLSTMTFVVTRFDGFGHLMRTPPDMGHTPNPPSIAGLEQLNEEYFYDVGRHNWYDGEIQLIIVDGPFLASLWEAGIPSTYTIQLETHRQMVWKIQVEPFGIASVHFNVGWSRFAHDTGLNSSHCLKLRLFDGGLITAVIFHSRKGHLITPEMTNANQGSRFTGAGSSNAIPGAVRSHGGASNLNAASSNVGTILPDGGAVDIEDNGEPYVIGRVWEMQVHDDISRELQWFPACTMMVYESFAYLPQSFVAAHNIALRKEVFIFQSLGGDAMLLKLVPHCNTLFLTEGYPAFKQHFQLITNSELSLHMVGMTHFVFNIAT